MEKIWKYGKILNGFEGLYQVSNLGRVRSLYFNREKILKAQVNHKGYLKVCLYKNGIAKQFFVHRLVAGEFIYNKYNKPQINHINGIKSDNRVENLEWCTCSENMSVRSIKKSVYAHKKYPPMTSLDEIINYFGNEI